VLRHKLGCGALVWVDERQLHEGLETLACEFNVLPVGHFQGIVELAEQQGQP
jgi:hypothetical protein